MPRRALAILAVAVVVVLLVVLLRPRGVSTTGSPTSSASSASPASPGRGPATPGPAGDTSDAPALRQAHLLPDPSVTPGATLDVTAADICVPGYSKKVRNVPADVKRQAYAEYGIASHQPGEYEVDHLISLELGGSNSIRNLWPQSYVTHPWNAHVKDQLENELHRAICAHEIDVATAQREIAGDWVAAWRAHFHRALPEAAGR